MHISKEYIVNADDSVNNIILYFVKHVNTKICKQIACKAVRRDLCGVANNESLWWPAAQERRSGNIGFDVI